jgi:hypothetical protein
MISAASANENLFFTYDLTGIERLTRGALDRSNGDEDVVLQS